MNIVIRVGGSEEGRGGIVTLRSLRSKVPFVGGLKRKDGARRAPARMVHMSNVEGSYAGLEREGMRVS